MWVWTISRVLATASLGAIIAALRVTQIAIPRDEDQRAEQGPAWGGATSNVTRIRAFPDVRGRAQVIHNPIGERTQRDGADSPESSVTVTLTRRLGSAATQSEGMIWVSMIVECGTPCCSTLVFGGGLCVECEKAQIMPALPLRQEGETVDKVRVSATRQPRRSLVHADRARS